MLDIKKGFDMLPGRTGKYRRDCNLNACNILKGYDSSPPFHKGSSLPFDPLKINKKIHTKYR
jgi:hypothetical protein